MGTAMAAWVITVVDTEDLSSPSAQATGNVVPRAAHITTSQRTPHVYAVVQVGPPPQYLTNLNTHKRTICRWRARVLRQCTPALWEALQDLLTTAHLLEHTDPEEDTMGSSSEAARAPTRFHPAWVEVPHIHRWGLNTSTAMDLTHRLGSTAVQQKPSHLLVRLHRMLATETWTPDKIHSPFSRADLVDYQ